MSAIGEYVHYNASRYMKYGTNREDSKQNVSKTWKTIHNNIAKKVKTKTYSNKELKEIEKQYNIWRAAVTAGSDYKAVRDIIQKLMIAKFTSLNEDSTVFNFESGRLYNLDKATVSQNIQNLHNTIKKSSSVKGKNVTYAETILKKFRKAYDDLKQIQPVSSQAEIKLLLNDLLFAFQEAVKAHDLILKELKLVGVHKSKKVLKPEDANAIIDILNWLMGANNSQKFGKELGTFEEYIGHATNLAIQVNAGRVIENYEETLKKEFLSGGSHITIGSTGGENIIEINQEIMKGLKDSNFIIKDESGKYTFKTQYSSEQKMDVSFMYDPANKKEAALSIKNYNLSSTHPIHIVSSSPLSTFLFNIGNIDTVNHFLNIFASHKNPSAEFRSCRQIANDVFALYLLWAGLSGKGVGKTSGTADVFVVNDNHGSFKNKVKMWDIGSLISKIIDKNNLQSDLIVTPGINKIILENRWQSGEETQKLNIQRRLAILITNAHAVKIEASINKKVLQY